jgi:hypothetical protein
LRVLVSCAPMRRFLLALLLLPLLWLTWLGGRWFVAEVLVLQTSSALQRWEARQGADLQLAEWNAAMQDIRQAIRIRPGYATARELQARLWQFRYLGVVQGDPWQDEEFERYLELREEIAAEALDALREGIRLRPTWPRSRLLLAQLEFFFFEDEDLLPALEKTLALGPEANFVLYPLADFLAMEALSFVSYPHLREFAVDYFSRILAPDGIFQARHLQILREREALEYYCPWLDVDALVQPAQRACAPFREMPL